MGECILARTSSAIGGGGRKKVCDITPQRQSSSSLLFSVDLSAIEANRSYVIEGYMRQVTCMGRYADAFVSFGFYYDGTRFRNCTGYAGVSGLYTPDNNPVQSTVGTYIGVSSGQTDGVYLNSSDTSNGFGFQSSASYEFAIYEF